MEIITLGPHPQLASKPLVLLCLHDTTNSHLSSLKLTSGLEPDPTSFVPSQRGGGGLFRLAGWTYSLPLSQAAVGSPFQGLAS